MILPAIIVFAEKRADIPVVFPSEAMAYKKAWTGFQTYFDKNRVILKSTEYNMMTQKSETIFTQIINSNPDLVVTMGTETSIRAREKIINIPLVFSMVLDPFGIGLKTNNLTGASLDIPMKRQFDNLKEIAPEVKKIGVIFNPQENGKIIAEAKKIANSLNLLLITFPVNSAREIPKIENMEIDALFMVPDNIVCKQAIISHILLSCLKLKIPVIGISPAFAKAGALFALSCDYEDIGYQTGEIALTILNGESPANIPITEPRKTDLYVNLAVAKRLGIEIPDKVLKKAKQVFGR